MNNGGGGGQPAPGEQRRPNIPMFKPEQMRGLPDQFSSDKEKWENGLRQLWNQLGSHGPETQQYQEAKRKIFEFSKTLTAKMQNFRAQQQQQAQQGGGAAGGVGIGIGGSGSARPVSQGQPQAGQAGENSAPKPNPEQVQQQVKPQPRVSAKVMEHVAKFPYVVPANVNPNSPDAAKWIAEAKNRYLKGLVSMENASARLTQMDAMVQKRMNEGKPLNPEEEKDYKEKKETFQKAHSEAKGFVDTFRMQQTQAKVSRDARDTSNGGQGSPTQPQVGGAPANNGQAVRPQMNPQQQPQNPALQNTQTVNAAIEAARNQQMGGARPQLPQNGQMSQAGQVPTPSAPSIPHQSAGQNTNSNPNIKIEAGVPPPINTAISQMQQRPNLNSPQSAVPQSAGPPQSATSQAQQIPRALTHSAALTQAARSYSNGGAQNPSAPHVMGHSHPSTTQRETQNIVTNKMPIPKYLDERSAAPPQPVPINQSRPTFSGGPSNSGSGVMAQPVLPKTPGFNMASDDNRVLSRKKLDELVKQVTGGGQGDGPSLMPEVEESMLTVADSFVDQVLHNACKMAKERGSKVLEIRDIQLTLERNYNIRIPGYASDEIRTVRKIQPAPAWIAKMSAVQAAKVTGGKNSD